MQDPVKEELYYVIEVNCRHRPPIKELISRIRVLKSNLENYELKWQRLKVDLNQKVPKAKKYKAVKGDKIDEMFAEALNRSAYADLRVERLGPGKYMFGTKKIMAKIINNKLVIRVGGGYMAVDEFIEQYGRMELMKMIAKEDGGLETGGDDGRGGSAADMKRIKEKTDAMMATSGGSIKAGMRDTMMQNMTTYSVDSRVRSVEAKAGRKDINFGQASMKDLQTQGIAAAKISTGAQMRQSLGQLSSPKAGGLGSPGSGRGRGGTAKLGAGSPKYGGGSSPGSRRGGV